MPDFRLSNRLAVLLAVLAGAVAALGFQPWGVVPLAIVGVAVLLALIDRAVGVRQAAWAGWWFGVGHFSAGLTWIAMAFTFQAKMPAALGWVAVVGLSMFLALYVALAAGLARAAARTPVGRVLVLAAAWMLGEWLRGWVLSGFAWNPLGAAWVTVPGVRQLAQFIGALGLSGVTVLLGGGLWLLLRPGGARVERMVGAGIGAAVAIIGLAATSLNREHYYPDSPPVFLVQPNIGQDQKYVPGAQEAHLQTYLDLTVAALAAARGGDGGIGAAMEAPVQGAARSAGAAPGAPALTTGAARSRTDDFGAARVDAGRGAIIVWSESSVPYAVEEEPAVRARLAAALGPDDLLLFGGLAVIRDARGEVTALTNSLFVLDAAGKLHGRYDKAHLVPLGEYVPARPLMTQLGLARLTPGDLDFQPGPGPRTLALPGFPSVGVQICYEIIFPGAVIDAGNRPAWIVNVSNDAWFGASGPPQHLAQARLRAIEEGLPVVRATPTGISAIVDGHGNVIVSQPAATQGVVSAALPPPLPATLFARYGHQASLVFGLVLLGAGLWAERRRAA